jgi:quinol monooxygenase YgiN
MIGDMPRLIHLLIGSLLMSSGLAAPQNRAEAPADTAFYAVSYVEVMPSSRPAAITALKHYREASLKDDGYVRFEIFEQVGRPGHFGIIETWRDQKAFEARGVAVQTGLLDALKPIRVSDYDQRPYKTLTVGAATPVTSRTIAVVTHVDVSPDPSVPAMLKRLAEMSRQDEGNVRFDVLQHTMRANHFTVIEIWRSQQALDAHVAAAHTRQYRDELQPMTGSPLDERVYKAVE